jgi:hypothetical protein
MLTVIVDAAEVGAGADVVGAVGAAAEGDTVPPPPQLKSRSDPAIAAPAQDTREKVFIRVHESNRGAKCKLFSYNELCNAELQPR